MNASSVTSVTAALPGMADPRRLARLPASEQVKAAAGQFEAILLRQFLTESVGNIMGSGAGGNVYGYMLTDLLAAKLSEGGGLGLGPLLERQLAPRPAVLRPDAGAKENP
ncbi:MAG TPA: rod-binding protein [Opitutaceae bacterium]|nr:rod-binding protein [Opitutaceae bacterium]